MLSFSIQLKPFLYYNNKSYSIKTQYSKVNTLIENRIINDKIGIFDEFYKFGHMNYCLSNYCYSNTILSFDVTIDIVEDIDLTLMCKELYHNLIIPEPILYSGEYIENDVFLQLRLMNIMSNSKKNRIIKFSNNKFYYLFNNH